MKRLSLGLPLCALAAVACVILHSPNLAEASRSVTASGRVASSGQLAEHGHIATGANSLIALADDKPAEGNEPAEGNDAKAPTGRKRPGADAPGEDAARRAAEEKLIASKTPEEWVKELGSGDEQRCDLAAMVLGRLGPKAKAVVPQLIEILERDEVVSRRQTLYVLGAIGPAAKSAVPAIRKKLDHSEFHTQYWACRALAKIGPDAKESTPDLIRLLKAQAASVRRNAALAIGGIGPDAGAEVIEPLIERMRTDRAQPVRADAATALGLLGKVGVPAVPELKAAALDEQRHIRIPAAVALWRLTKRTEDALPVLLSELASPNEPWEAAGAFQVLGAAAAPAVPEIIAILKSDDPELRLHACAALQHIGPEAKSARAALESLRDNALEDDDIRDAAKAALAVIAAEPKK